MPTINPQEEVINEYSFYLSTKRRESFQEEHASIIKRSAAWFIDRFISTIIFAIISFGVFFLLLLTVPDEFPAEENIQNEYRRNGYNMADPQQSEEFWDLPDNHLDGMGYIFIVVWILITIFLISGVIYGGIQLFFLFRFNQTIGMRCMNIMIISTKDVLLQPYQIVIRSLAAEIPLCIPKIGWLVHAINYGAVFRKSRQCFHDQLSDTVVIDLINC